MSLDAARGPASDPGWPRRIPTGEARTLHQYDTTLKDILFGWPTTLIEAIAGCPVKHWRNVELPQVNAPRVDLLGMLVNGSLLHLEMQSYDDPDLVWHMLTRKAQIRAANKGKSPDQVVVWVGDAALTMPSEIRERDLVYRVRMIDIRVFDAGRMLASGLEGDALLAILCQMGDRRRTIRAILDRICAMPVERRMAALQRVLLLSGLRRWAKELQEEVNRVPVLLNYMEHELFRDSYLRGKEEGVAEGESKGEIRGEIKGEARGAARLLARMLERRFGPLPNWASVRIADATPVEIDEWAGRVFDAPSLDRVFAP